MTSTSSRATIDIGPLDRRSQNRAAEALGGSATPDMAKELKRLRRGNEILRQERDILKRATAFFARAGSRKRALTAAASTA